MEHVKSDMEYLDITNADIILRKKNELKKVLKEKSRKTAFQYLIKKAKSHNKIKEILKFDLYNDKFKASNYFTYNRFTPDLSNLIFMFRTRMYDVKNNFRKMYKHVSLKCKLCDAADESQEHLYQCEVLTKVIGQRNYNYEHMFSNNLEHLYDIAKKTKELVKIRDLLLNP